MGWTIVQTTAVIVAVIAFFGTVVVAPVTYWLNRRAAHRERRAHAFGEALSVVEDYAEMPYRIRRRLGTAEGRNQLTEEMSRIYSRLAFHQALLDVEAPPVGVAYRYLATEAKKQMGGQIKTAWTLPVLETDAGMNLERPYDRARVDAARADCVEAMRAALRLSSRFSPVLRRLRGKVDEPRQRGVVDSPEPK